MDIKVEFLLAAQNGQVDKVASLSSTYPSLQLLKMFTSGEDVLNNFPSLVDVVRQGHSELLEFLLEKGANVRYICPRNNLNALMEACLDGNFAMVDLLLHHHAPIDYVTLFSKKSALNSAAQGGHVAIIELLIARGATLPAPQEDVEENDRRLAEHPAIVAARHGQLAVVDWFLMRPEFGVRLDTVFIDNKYYRDDVESNIDCTLLMEAARNGHKQLINYLVLEHRANINQQNQEGDCALSLSCKTEHTQVVQLLLQLGAQIDLPAVFYRQDEDSKVNPQCVNLLLEADADLQCLEAVEHTLQHRNADLAELFLANGVEFPAIRPSVVSQFNSLFLYRDGIEEEDESLILAPRLA